MLREAGPLASITQWESEPSGLIWMQSVLIVGKAMDYRGRICCTEYGIVTPIPMPANDVRWRGPGTPTPELLLFEARCPARSTASAFHGHLSLSQQVCESNWPLSSSTAFFLYRSAIMMGHPVFEPIRRCVQLYPGAVLPFCTGRRPTNRSKSRLNTRSYGGDLP